MSSETAPLLPAEVKSGEIWWNKPTISFIFLFLLVIGLLVGIIFLSQKKDCDDATLTNPYFLPVKQNLNREMTIRKLLFEELSSDNSDSGALAIKNNLRILTKKVHVAGTKENMEVLAQVFDAYKRAGLDSIHYTPYEVLLNYPDYGKPNTISLKDGDTWTLVSNGTATKLGPPDALEQESGRKSLIWWTAYSANGTAEGPLVYANRGTLEDYQTLDKMNVSLNGVIVLVRYGMLWRGSKVAEAEKRGAKGVAIFSDPMDYGPSPNESAENVFPKSINLPPTGAQRGSLLQMDGDPLTPFYPAKNYTYRTKTIESLQEEFQIPRVPVTPIGYRDARSLFESMDGPPAPNKFVGSLQPSGLYKLSSSKVYRLTVHSRMKPRARIQNVIGILKGKEEPDRMVLLSNHVDAWTYGSQDPNSGTAVLMELSRALMAVVNKTGWRPRRSIVFCSWDAEEYSLLGSNEWVEEYFKVLQSRAVAVINVDIAVKGNISLKTSAVPLLYQTLAKASQWVPNPNIWEILKGRETIFDSWFYYDHPLGKSSFLPPERGIPRIAIPGSGSDHETFLTYVGVPVAFFSYECRPSSCYKLYHSMYEIAWLVENLVDHSFKGIIIHK